MTPARRRVTLAILCVALLGAALLSVSPRNAADAEVTAGVVAPVALATAAVPSTAIEAETSTTSTTEPEVTTTETTLVEETTTSTTEAEAAPAEEAAVETAAAPAPVAPPPTAAPTTTAPPPPPPPASSGDPTSIIRGIFGGHAEAALVIARCESSLNPGATNPAGYYGLFQIGTGHASRFESVTGTSWSSGRYDARANTTYAKWLFDGDGQTWGQWGCRHRL